MEPQRGSEARRWDPESSNDEATRDPLDFQLKTKQILLRLKTFGPGFSNTCIFEKSPNQRALKQTFSLPFRGSSVNF